MDHANAPEAVTLPLGFERTVALGEYRVMGEFFIGGGAPCAFVPCQNVAMIRYDLTNAQGREREWNTCVAHSFGKRVEVGSTVELWWGEERKNHERHS